MRSSSHQLPLASSETLPVPMAVDGAGRVVALVGAEFEENLSLRYLAAALSRAGFAPRIFAFNDPAALEPLARAVCEVDPLVVGISVPFQHRAAELLGVGDALRATGYRGHVVAGGHFATFEYANIFGRFAGIDSVIRHEGEEALVELCRQVAGGSLALFPGLVLRAPGGGAEVGEKRPIPRLDSLAPPLREGEPHDILGVRGAPIIGSRGCYADCSFCCIYAYAENARGARYRMRSPENVVAEMKQDYTARGVRTFVFHDDNFFVPHAPTNLKRYRQFADLLRAEAMTDIALVLKCRPNDVDRELFGLLKSMGLVRAYVGIETNSDAGVVSLNRRITSADNRRALLLLRELDIYCSFNVLIFDPEADLGGVAANLSFMEEFAEVPFNFCRAEVYAGTPLKAILEQQGRLSGDFLAWGYRMRDPRTELLFRIATSAFSSRNFKSDGVANLNMGVRLDNEMFRRFYPELSSDEFQGRLVSLSRRIGLDSVAHMRRALAFVQLAAFDDPRGSKRFAIDLARDVARADLGFVGEVKALRREMEARVRAAGGRGIHRPYGEGMKPWAAETARLGNSVGSEFSTERLPAPQA